MPASAPPSVHPPPTPSPPPRPGPHVLDATMFWGREPTGGVRRVLCARRRHLRAAGWQHTLLLPWDPGALEAPGPMAPAGSGQEVSPAGLLVCGGVPLPRSGGYRFVTDRAAAVRLMVRARPDLIEAADPYTLGWAVRDAAQQLGVPAVAFCHSHLPAQLERWTASLLGPWGGRAAARLARRYLVRLYDGYDLVLAPSATMAAQLRDWGLWRVQHQPLGVDCQRFRPEAAGSRPQGWLQQALGLPPVTRLLLYCGRFAPEKRLALLVQAVQALGPGHLLLCVGAGPCPPAGRHVRVLPPEPDAPRLAALMASCDAFVHAGNEETFGLAALEAMACGVPTVLSDQAGLGELGAGAACCVQGDRPADWAAALRQTLDGRDEARLNRALARARTLDWPRVIERMCERYLLLIRTQAGTVGGAAAAGGGAPGLAAGRQRT